MIFNMILVLYFFQMLLRILLASSSLVFLSAGNCPIAGDDSFVGSGLGKDSWYASMVYCVLYASPFTSPEDLSDCVFMNDGTGNKPNRIGSLSAGLNYDFSSQLSACFECIYEFAESMYALNLEQGFSVIAPDCWDDSSPVWTGKVFTRKCQDHLRALIDAFNTCSGNGYDFASGALANSDGSCANTGDDTFVGSEVGKDSWYAAVMYCVFSSGPFDNPEELSQCLSTAVVVGPGVEGRIATDPNPMDLNHPLQSGLDFQESSSLVDCHRCIYEFAQSASILHLENPDIQDDCWGDNWVTKAFSGICRARLHVAIDAFNTCAGNGYDFITGELIDEKCSTSEFMAFAIKYNPMDTFARCQFAGITGSVEAMLNCVAVRESANVGGSGYYPFLTDYRAMTCRECFDSLANEIRLFDDYAFLEDEEYNFRAGEEDLNVVLSNYATCTGGLIFALESEDRCTVEDSRIVAAMRPYLAAMMCPFDFDLVGRRLKPCSQRNGGCVVTIMMMESAVSDACQSHIEDYLVYQISTSKNMYPACICCIILNNKKFL